MQVLIFLVLVLSILFLIVLVAEFIILKIWGICCQEMLQKVNIIKPSILTLLNYYLTSFYSWITEEQEGNEYYY